MILVVHLTLRELPILHVRLCGLLHLFEPFSGFYVFSQLRFLFSCKLSDIQLH